MKQWRTSTDHMEDRAVVLTQQYDEQQLAAFRPDRGDFDPEGRFTELVHGNLAPDDVVVDIGTGDGTWFLAEIYPRVRRAVGLDGSAGRMWLAIQQRAALRASAEFLLCDARHTPLRDHIASAIISRRGPWMADEDFTREGLRILAQGGLALEISIGEQNAQELNEPFGERAQMQSQRTRDRLAERIAQYNELGFEVLVAESHVAPEVFSSREALVYRLRTTPSIDAFDPDRDAALVDRVVSEHGVGNGVRLTVHRICLVARITR